MIVGAKTTLSRASLTKVSHETSTGVPLSEILREQHPDIFSEATTLHRFEGGTNEVFLCKNETGNLVVRMSPVNVLVGDTPPTGVGWSRYHKEAWACQCAATIGVRTPEVFHVGYFKLDRMPLFGAHNFAARTDLPAAYMLQQHVPGDQLSTWNGFLADPKLMRFSGQLAARIHTISTTGYGDIFNTERCQFSASSWSAYWHETLGADVVDGIRRMKFLDEPVIRALESTIEEVAAWNFRPGLIHGDLRPENIISAGDEHVVIDWERARSGPTPEWEIAILLLETHPYSERPEKLMAFLSGLGISESDYQKNYERRVKMLALLTILPSWYRMECARLSLGQETSRPFVDAFSPEQYCTTRRNDLSNWINVLTHDLSKARAN